MRARDRLEPGAHQTGLRCGTPVARAGLRGASSMAARRKPPRARARGGPAPRRGGRAARAENEQLRRQQAYSDLSDAASSFNSRTSLSRSYDQELADLRGSNERLLAEQRSPRGRCRSSGTRPSRRRRRRGGATAPGRRGRRRRIPGPRRRRVAPASPAAPASPWDGAGAAAGAWARAASPPPTTTRCWPSCRA